MSRPKVSIGMPVYNGGVFLQQALQSILVQSFTDFELIISDNASVDDTEAIISEFRDQDNRIRYIRQSENIGPIANFNYVLDKARADCFIWAAGDDLWDEDWIKVLFNNLNKSVAISFGHVNNIDSNGKLVRTYKSFGFHGSKSLRMIKYYLAEDYNGKANIIYGMYHTKAIKNNGMREEYNGCYFGVDMLFVFDCLQRGKIVCDESVLIYKRTEDGALPPASFIWRIKNSLLMFNRLRYFSVYSCVASSVLDKFLLALLIPVKYFKSLLLNVYRLARVK